MVRDHGDDATVQSRLSPFSFKTKQPLFRYKPQGKTNNSNNNKHPQNGMSISFSYRCLCIVPIVLVQYWYRNGNHYSNTNTIIPDCIHESSFRVPIWNGKNDSWNRKKTKKKKKVSKSFCSKSQIYLCDVSLIFFNRMGYEPVSR